MAKKFQGYPKGFDSDLDAILNRVYGSSESSSFKSGSTKIPQSFARHEQDSLELKDALSKLRDHREKSQSTMRMKEELAYLQEQVQQLKALREEIEALRARLEAESDQD
ncbi:DUF5320 domain-containing protein [Thiorhodococcus mannitoliphagus]|uniref:DUF5320 domain-containing protein n=1 Tax=Thiorhodococcus mannitoliphagus TaxID=329406 RepID=A0A6P1E4P4_9GAMM|nr:DUF5320 domain-containing protein [Thiorhodococcus mannitoliphagus]NEX22994.1 DUF5320 domain-containing protein [Thiorhodococcus mannitoliphagus]